MRHLVSPLPTAILSSPLVSAALLLAASGCGLVRVQSSSTGPAAGVAAAPTTGVADCRNVKPYPGNQPPASFEDDSQLLQAAHDTFSGWNDGQPITQARTLSLYQKAKVRLPVMGETYAPTWCETRRNNGAPGTKESDLIATLADLKRFDNILAANAQAAPARVDEQLASARKLLAGYDKDSVINRGASDFDMPDSDVGQVLASAELQVEIVATALGPKHPNVTAIRDKITALRVEVQQLRAAIADRNVDHAELPKDLYAGADKAMLKDVYRKEAEAHLKKKVLAVFLINADWNRSAGSQWIGDRLVPYDQGFVSGDVLVPLDDSTAEVVRFTPRKDWLDGGKIKFDVYEPRPVGKVRLAKLQHAR